MYQPGRELSAVTLKGNGITSSLDCKMVSVLGSEQVLSFPHLGGTPPQRQLILRSFQPSCSSRLRLASWWAPFLQMHVHTSLRLTWLWSPKRLWVSLGSLSTSLPLNLSASMTKSIGSSPTWHTPLLMMPSYSCTTLAVSVSWPRLTSKMHIA